MQSIRPDFYGGPITCPDCDGGFIEEIDNHADAARVFHAGFRGVGSNRFPATEMYNDGSIPASTILRRSRRNGGDRSPFNPVIVLHGGAATSSSASPSSGGENSNVEQNGERV
ncbi:hypothetical protein DITRI_Ditri09bG0063600 [Diplodiscus trichospermus]